MLFKNFNKNDSSANAKQLVKYYKRFNFVFLKIKYILKMSHWYQMNPKVFLNKTALSAQLPCLAGLSL